MKRVPVSPRDVHVLVTAKCNLACKHCSIYGDGPIHGDLTTDQWRDIIGRLSAWKVLKLTVSGGEPLVREDFGEIVEAILSHPLRFSLNTNAMLVTDEVARLLGRATPRLESVMVSLDGAGPATHDEQRAPGAFDAMAEGVERLRRAGVPVGFDCTVTTINVGETEEIAEWALARGAWVKFNDVLAVGRACADSGLVLTQQQRRIQGNTIFRLAREHSKRVGGTLLEMHEFAGRILGGTAPSYSQGSRGCGAMRGQLCIWPDGRCTPCDRLPHFTVGSVIGTSLPELWRGKKAAEFRRALSVPISELGTCRDCAYLPFCSGGCPVLPMHSPTPVLQRDPGSCVRLLLGEEVAHG